MYIVPYYLDASASFDNVAFDGNSATIVRSAELACCEHAADTPHAQGGAFYVDFGTPQALVSATRSSFTDSVAGVKARARCCQREHVHAACTCCAHAARAGARAAAHARLTRHTCQGGAIYAAAGVLDFTDCVFTGNLVQPVRATPHRVGVVTGRLRAVRTISHSCLSGCSSPQSFNDANGQKTVGGAVAVDGYPQIGEEQLGLPVMGSSLTLRGCTLRNNTVALATGLGGAVYVGDANEFSADYFADSGSSATLVDSVLEDNAAAHGGALYAGAGSSLEVQNSALSGNSGSGAGGGVAASGAAVSVVLAASNFTANAAVVAGAALWVNAKSSGGVLQLADCGFALNAVAGPTPHGGALSAENVGVVSLQRCTFANNSVVLTALDDAAAAMDIALQYAPTTAYGAGAGGALLAVAAAAMQLSALGCVFEGNTAQTGGAAALLSGVTATLEAVMLAHNSASASGGALHLDGLDGDTAGSSLLDSRLVGNTAPQGGALALSGAHALTLSNVTATGNAAEYGAVLFAAASVANASAQLALSALSGAGNAAAASGGVLFVQGAAAGNPQQPACAACDASEGNTAGSYGPYLASPPVRFEVLSPAATRSAALLPVSVVAYDAYGSVVQSWPQLVATAACFDAATGALAPGAVSGVTPALYAGGSAAFASLALAGGVGASFTLALTLTSATLPAFAGGMSVSVNVSVAPCDVSEAFDAAASRCACLVNSIRLAATDTSCVCVPGYFWSAAAAACAPCPDGAACSDGLALTGDGYWRRNGNDTFAYECASNRCLAVEPPEEAATTTRHLLQHSSLTEAYVVGSNCTLGHAGPLCAVCCAPGVAGCADGVTYAYQGDVCVACKPSDAWDSWAQWQKGLLLFFVALLSLAVLFLVFLLPLFPGVSSLLLVVYSRLCTAALRVNHALFGTPLADKGAELQAAEAALRRKSVKLHAVSVEDAAAADVNTADADDDTPAGSEPDADAPAEELVKRERRKMNYMQLQAKVEDMSKPVKIIINFLQARH
jgi:hypothetical protein